MIKFKPRTAPQILEHYYTIDTYHDKNYHDTKEIILKAMRHYARVKSDIAYEKGFQTALKLYNLK